jgi:hypothetical protein
MKAVPLERCFCSASAYRPTVQPYLYATFVSCGVVGASFNLWEPLRVQHLDWRKEAVDDANEALPGEVRLLAGYRSPHPSSTPLKKVTTMAVKTLETTSLVELNLDCDLCPGSA